MSEYELTVQDAVNLAAEHEITISRIYIQRLCLEMRLAARMVNHGYVIDRADFLKWLFSPRPRGNPNLKKRQV